MTEYHDWKGFDFKPKQEIIIFPDKLLERLQVPSTILEIGCDKGKLSLDLAYRGYNVVGVDINESAIETAINVQKERQLNNAEFLYADLCNQEEWSKINTKKVDAVILIKVLTVLPRSSQRKCLINNLIDNLAPETFIYIYDFYLNRDNPAYSRRYEEGVKLFGEWGTFEVKGENGRHMYYAHHHTEEEIKELAEQFDVVSINYLETISYHGNKADTFEFIGRVKGDNNEQYRRGDLIEL